MSGSYKIRKNKEFIEKNYNKLPNGQLRLKKGTQIGRMPKKGFTLSDINKMIREYEEAEGKEKNILLKHYIKRLYKNDWLLAKFMDKNIPTKSVNELTGPGGDPLNITLREIIYGKDEKEVKKEEKGKSENSET